MNLSLLPQISRDILTAFEKNEIFIAPEDGAMFPQVNLPPDFKGLILASSGTNGERNWIFHPWMTLENIGKREKQKLSVLSFLSPGHAAGIELLFRCLFSDSDLRYTSEASTSRCEVISLTPVSLWKLFANTQGRQLLSEAKEVRIGGEAPGRALLNILFTQYPHLGVKLIYGTTESWGIETIHHGEGEIEFNDPVARAFVAEDQLFIDSPYLARTYISQDGSFREIIAPWNTGDRLLKGNKGYFFLPREGRFGKHAGKKYLSGELEQTLMEKFQLPWVQVLWIQDDFLGQKPRIIFPKGLLPKDLIDWLNEQHLISAQTDELEIPLATPRGKKR